MELWDEGGWQLFEYKMFDVHFFITMSSLAGNDNCDLEVNKIIDPLVHTTSAQNLTKKTKLF